MPPLRIQVSGSAGFCWGVERALELTREAAEQAKGPICTLGPLIHNPTVIADLKARGIGVVDSTDQCEAETVIIRSHGVPQEVISDLCRRGFNVVDATCRFVKAAQEKAAQLHDKGYLVVILGEKDHPEVMGLRSYAGEDSLVAEEPADLPTALSSGRVGVVVQTTQSRERLAALASWLAPRVKELLIHNTICSATEQRQQAAVRMAAHVDMVIVVGGRNSGNTRRLAELCREVQPRTHHVELPEEIAPEWLGGVQDVGVTAGASTPPEQIDAVVRHLRRLGDMREAS